MDKGEIILYQPDDTIKLDVRIEADTVWLTQAQMGILFDVDRTVIVKHIANIYKTCELEESATCVKIAQVQSEGNRMVTREHHYFNLDMIISVGYKVNSINATKFRQWATCTLKSYLLHGYAVNRRIEQLENKVSEHDKQIAFFVRTSLPPVQGIFYDGQIFDAYVFASELIRSAKSSITLAAQQRNLSTFSCNLCPTLSLSSSTCQAHITSGNCPSHASGNGGQTAHIQNKLNCPMPFLIQKFQLFLQTIKIISTKL